MERFGRERRLPKIVARLVQDDTMNMLIFVYELFFPMFKKIIKKRRKEQHLPDSYLQTAASIECLEKIDKKPELSANTVTFHQL